MNHSGATGVPRRGGLRRAHWVVLAGIVLCLVLVGGVLLYLSPVLALLDNHDLSPGKPLATPAATPPPLDSKQRVNILLLGSDNDQKFAQDAVLSQTMIVVSIDPAKRQVTLLSLPRDLWVAIPGHARAKIDLAYAEGGAPLARATVEKAFRIPIHYYAWIGLNGLVKVVDRLGGVDVDVLHPVLDDNYPNDFSNSGYGTERVYLAAGPQHLDGRHTLQYVRSRHGDLLSDFGRSVRQQQVLLAMQQRTAGMDLVTALPSFARDLNGRVKTDLDLLRLTQLMLFMRGLRAGDVRQAFITPFVRDAVSPDGQQILTADWPAVNAYLRQRAERGAAARSWQGCPARQTGRRSRTALRHQGADAVPLLRHPRDKALGGHQGERPGRGRQRRAARVCPAAGAELDDRHLRCPRPQPGIDHARGRARGQALGVRAPLLRRWPADRVPHRSPKAAVKSAEPAAQRPRCLRPGSRRRPGAAAGRAGPLHRGRQRSGVASGSQRAAALYNLSLWRRTARARGAPDLDVVTDGCARLPVAGRRPQFRVGLLTGRALRRVRARRRRERRPLCHAPRGEL
ncbi:MAG: LytR family transcriptional regulator [Chloroflexi bacterium]|nr:MAG: LytR family transcriptional regulator [Chloroflexota bacterium]